MSKMHNLQAYDGNDEILKKDQPIEWIVDVKVLGMRLTDWREEITSTQSPESSILQ